MRQKVKVISVIERDGKILVLQKADGSIELPQGVINFGEQPIQAVKRVNTTIFRAPYIKDYILSKVVSEYIDSSMLFIVYKTVSYERFELSEYQNRYSKIYFKSPANLSQEIQNLINEGDDSLDADRVEVDDEYYLFTDGASRGNPGVSAVGYAIVRGGKIIESSGEFLGVTNSSQAEYYGLKAGLNRALELGIKSLHVCMDNLMVINHMNGFYRINNREFWPIYDRIKKLSEKFENIDFRHVPREKNLIADGQANDILDKSMYIHDFHDIIK